MKTTRRSVLGLLAGAATVVGVPSFWIYHMKTYAGPVSDHFDGTHFFDPDGAPPKSLGEVLRWQFGGGRQRHAWPEQAPSPYADTPPARVTGNTLRFSFVGHASWLIQTSGLNILIDPVWSERASPTALAGPKRHNDPGIAFDALPPIDIVLVSHGHYDHLDIATLSKLAATFSPRVIAPLGNAVPIRSAAQAQGRFRLAILPIGAYEPRWFMKDQHMNPSDAVKALADCGASQALAHHHGTFQLTDEAIDAPVMALHEALDEAKIPREKFVALKPGQVFEI